jgi:catechol 2,3-dioxygenase
MTELGHGHQTVRDLDRSVAFYTDVFALTVTERTGRFAFLSFGERHHDIALQAVGPDAPGPGDGVGLYHAAIEVESAERLRTVYERLDERDVHVTPVDHGISMALYFDDPDGNGLEAYRDTRDRDDERWDGYTERLDPATL